MKFNIIRSDGKDAPINTDVTFTDTDGTGVTSNIAAGTPATSTKINAANFGTEVLNVTAADADIKKNANVLFEVSNVDLKNDKVTLKATISILNADGSTSTKTVDDIVLQGSATQQTDIGDKLGIGVAGAFKLGMKVGGTAAFNKGSKFVYNFSTGVNGVAARNFSLRLKRSLAQSGGLSKEVFRKEVATG